MGIPKDRRKEVNKMSDDEDYVTADSEVFGTDDGDILVQLW